jgi:hypothetical protein
LPALIYRPFGLFPDEIFAYCGIKKFGKKADPFIFALPKQGV